MDKDANNSAPSGETPAGADPQGETPTTTQGTGETPATTTPSIEDALREIESLKAALKKTNAESAAHRLKAKELDDLKAKIEADKLSEAERLQKQLADTQREKSDLTRQLQESRISAAVQLHAARLGFADPGDAMRFLDSSELDFDDNGAPTNVEDLLKAILKARPYLAGKPGQAQPTSGGATNPARSTSSAAPALSWEYISKLTPKDWATLTPERKKEIHNWQLEHPFRF